MINKKQIIVVDSNHLAHRCWYGIPNLTFDDQDTSIIYGFLINVFNNASFFKTKNFVFCWDSKRSYRRQIYPAYKENRKIRDKELTWEEIEQKKLAYNQFELLRLEVLPAIGFNNVFMSTGYEGDDLIAVVVSENKNCIVLSGDEDMYQLLDRCMIYNDKKRTIFTKSKFEEKYNISCTKWWEVKALGGCTSDNVKGINGVGEKTAIKYLTGKLNKNTATYTKIIENLDIKRINKPLVKLPYERKKKLTLPLKRTEFNEEGFLEVCDKFGFISFKKEIEKWKRMFK